MRSFNNRQTGIALVLVLWVLVMLTVIAAEFCRAMRTEVNIARNDQEAARAYYAAVGGVNLAISKILDTIAMPALPATAEETEAEAVDWRVNIDIAPLAVGEGSVRLRIDNEAGRVNLNLAGRNLLHLMLGGLNLSDEQKNVIVDSILDWRDMDHLHRLNGAENDYYQALPEPYACKNADFETAEELLRVRGVTAEVFYGGLAHRVTVYPDTRTAARKMGWEPGKAPEKGTFDFNKINPNAAPPQLLAALPGFSEEAVEAVTAFRADQDMRGSDLLKLVGSEAYSRSVNAFAFQLGPFYRVTARGAFGDDGAEQTVAALVFVDPKSLKKEYSIVQWNDRVDPGRLEE